MVRHFSTPLNEHKVSRGLMPVGIDREAAKKLAPSVAATLEKYGVDTLISSDLPRAVQSAKLIAEYMDKEPELEETPELETWDVGDMAGKKESETIPKRQKFIKYADEKPPGGEPFRDFLDRYRPQLEDIVERRAEGEEVAFIAHGHHLLSAPHILQDEDVDPDKLPDLDENFKPGGIFLFFVEGDKVRIECASGDCEGSDDDA